MISQNQITTLEEFQKSDINTKYEKSLLDKSKNQNDQIKVLF